VANLQLVATSNPQVMDLQGLDVQVLDFELRAAAKSYRQASMRIAYYAFRLRYALLDDWSPLGVKSEDDYRKLLGLAPSTFYKLLGIGSALYMVKLADMERIPVGNAELLMKVEPALWHDFPWVQEAQTLSADEFAAKIVQRNRTAGSDSEPMVQFQVKVPYSAKKFMQDTVEKFRQEHNLASAGQALEFLIADVHDRPNVMAAIERANRYVKWSMFRLRVRKKIDHEMRWLQRAGSLLNKAYWAVRMEDEVPIYEDDEKEVYPAETTAELQNYNEWIRDMSFLTSRPHGEEAPNHAGVPDADGDLRSVSEADEFDGDDDSFGEQG